MNYACVAVALVMTAFAVKFFGFGLDRSIRPSIRAMAWINSLVAALVAGAALYALK